jgi:YidC/Oxa1 family membrane protein insertase
MIFIALPFVFVTFVIQFPAGLLVYWITTNVWTIVQQTIIKKRLGPMRPALAEGESPPSLFGSLRDLGGGGSTSDDGKAKAPAKERATARTGGGDAKARPAGPPPSPPRRKKKRSGRRR